MGSAIWIEVDDLVQPQGGVYGPDFDRESIERVRWGSLFIQIFDDTVGQVRWESEFEDFGAGEHPLVRLARPMLAECADD